MVDASSDPAPAARCGVSAWPSRWDDHGTHRLGHVVGLVALAGACLTASSAARAQQKAAAPSPEEWRTALATIRQIALDDGETDEHRAHAVTAYVKALLWKKPRDHQEALKFCREVLKGAGKEPLFAAALRAGGRVERDRRGHLGAERDFLASFSRGSHAPTAATVRRELLAIIGKLAALGAKPMVPAPIACRLPAWAAAGPGQTPSALRITMPKIAPPPWYRFQPAKPHPALHVTHPKMQPPSWYRRVSFPPLKEPRK